MSDVEELVRLALKGDQTAWRDIVHRYQPMIWRIARERGLGAADAADAGQRVWIRLTENLAKIQAPARLAAWLATTARRECLKLLVERDRLDLPDLDVLDEAAGPEQLAVRGAQETLLWRAFSSLSDRCRQIVGLMAHAPELTHAQLASAAGVQPGSIGSIRGRCLETLRRKLSGLGVEAIG